MLARADMKTVRTQIDDTAKLLRKVNIQDLVNLNILSESTMNLG